MGSYGNTADIDKKHVSRLTKLLISGGLAATDTAVGLLGAEKIMPQYEFNYVFYNFGVELVPLLYMIALGISHLEVEGVYRTYLKVKRGYYDKRL